MRDTDKILRFHMGSGSGSAEPLPQAYGLRGGRALTSRIVCDEVEPGCDPLGPRNKLVMAPGLLSGTVLSNSSRISAGAKSPLTGGIKESNGGGQTGLKLAQLGYRALIIEGQPAAPGWWTLVVEADGARLEPADDLAGLGTFAAACCLFDRYGKKAALQVLGPPGEMQMNLAGICNTDPELRPSRICARGALGAVMGSKRLKAIVYSDAGYKPVAALDADLWKSAGKEYIQALRAHPTSGERMPKYGTAATMETINKLGGLPIRNFRRGQDGRTDAISGVRMREVILERGGLAAHSCMTGCAMQCSNVFVDGSGKEIASSMEFESNALLGANLEIYDFDWIARFTFECNDLGIDTVETGVTMGVAMEAGLVPWGDAEGVMRLLGEIRRGTVLGRILGSGAALAGRVLGVRRVPAVKGQAMAAYDPRAIKGNGVTYATSPMGADHTAGNTFAAKTDHLAADDKVAISRQIQIEATILDVLGFCTFAKTVVSTAPQSLVDLFNARLGTSFGFDELKSYAVNVILEEIAFNREAGLGPATDRLPEWMCSEPLPPHNSVFDVSDSQLDAIWEGW